MSERDRSDELQSLRNENKLLKTQQQETKNEVKELKEQISCLESTMKRILQELTDHDERHATILAELNRLKESVMDSNSSNMNNSGNSDHSSSNNTIDINSTDNNITASLVRSVPAPSKILVQDQKKKDNRLAELKRMTKTYMNVDEEEAGLRLFRLQKTMVHVVMDLKKYIEERGEDVSKSWKSIDTATQRVAFEMVEREAISLGVPLNLCIGYWGARRLISKSWANALRTTRKGRPREGGGPENHTEIKEDDGGDDSSEHSDNRLSKKPKLLSI
ncbi:hypothetical protein BD770DRAFT_392340 [Pilaira anomala]|nr:hypothetical protein BD770DRAFT_392340 [Pilaira anomala]